MSLIELRAVSKSFRAGDGLVRALDRASLTVEAGEVVAVVGVSGSGKTTLLLVAAGMLALDEGGGSVLFAGKDISGLDDDDGADHLRRNVGFVFQDYHLMRGLSAIDNVAFNLIADRIPMNEGRRRAAPWLARMGLDRRMHHRPAQLSGGERQRVAIARAFVREPRLLLADEPTASLDSRTGTQVLALITELCHERGTAAIIVTHDQAVAELADRVLLLRDGVLREHADRDAAGGPARARTSRP